MPMSEEGGGRSNRVNCRELVRQSCDKMGVVSVVYCILRGHPGGWLFSYGGPNMGRVSTLQ